MAISRKPFAAHGRHAARIAPQMRPTNSRGRNSGEIGTSPESVARKSLPHPASSPASLTRITNAGAKFGAEILAYANGNCGHKISQYIGL
jgi:hypothetical protein